MNLLCGEMLEVLRAYMSRGWDLYFFPFCKAFYLNDLRPAMHFAAQLPGMDESRIVTHIDGKPITPNQMISILSQFDLTLTHRFHGMIFSVMAGTPFVCPAAPVGKVNKFCETHSFQQYATPFDTGYGTFMRALETATKHSRTALKTVADNNKMRVQAKLDSIKESWLNDT